MERGSDKHGPALDDLMRSETEGLVRGGKQTHAEEFQQAEPSGEGQPDVDQVPDGTMSGSTPHGMTQNDVEGRSDVARYLGKDIYPAGREQLIHHARAAEAPDWVVDTLRRLPGGRRFDNVNEVWTVLGHGVEDDRF